MNVPHLANAPTIGTHWVKFYEDDAELFAPLTRFVSDGFRQGDGVVVIADQARQRALETALALDDAVAAREQRNLIVLDSDEVIANISKGGVIDEGLFSELVGNAVESMRAASSNGSVRVFGEAVGVLTEVGLFEQALELEACWNRLMTRSEIALFCAYPFSHFPTAHHEREFERICMNHTHVDPSSTRLGHLGGARAGTALAVLEQQARAAKHEAAERLALEAELARRKTELLRARGVETVALLGGGIAHDFNNYLTVIESASDYLLDTRLADEEQRQAILDIRAAAERAGTLSARLLALTTRRRRGPNLLEPNELIRELSRLFRRVVRNRAALSVELDDSVGTIRVDSAELEQILLNLVLNARDALEDHGAITIATRRATFASEGTGEQGALVPYVVIEVIDDGPGVPPTLRERIFEPFFTTKGNGFGLGLSTVKALVHENGGRIWLANTDRGARFGMAFPAFAKPGSSAS